MHEWALAHGVVRAALEVAGREGMTRLGRIEIRLGALQQVDPDVFLQALQAVLPRSEPRLEGTRFEVELEPARMLCRACGCVFDLESGSATLPEEEREAIHFLPEVAHGFLRCPECGSRDFEVTAGRGVQLAAVEGEVPGEGEP